MKTTFAVLFLCTAAFSGLALAQTAAAPASQIPAAAPAKALGQTKDPISTSLRSIQQRQQRNILGAIDAMPADKFSYKPTADQITFGHLVVHITESNNAMCAKAADVPEPKVAELKDTDPKDKLAAAAKASFDFCTDALAKMDDSKLGDNLDFGRFQGPRAMAVFFTAGGWSDHYGAAAMYLRLNGITPPSAQPRK